jgi:hypothetical protein
LYMNDLKYHGVLELCARAHSRVAVLSHTSNDGVAGLPRPIQTDNSDGTFSSILHGDQA